MKNYLKSSAVALVLGAAFLTSCGESTDTPVVDPVEDLTTITEDITEDITISDDITLVGEIHVKNGAVLTVDAGVTITADASELSYLLIESGSQLIAEGTADNPIVFTANDSKSGAWGGLHICGSAPINSGDTGLSEIGNATYGGTNEDDNSGIIKYVRVEYSGTALDDQHEANGISFYGTGSGTTVDYVQIWIGNDDGIECFGGTVDLKHIHVYGAADDSFDWTEGWSGNGQFLIAEQIENVGDRGIEGDNLGSDNSADPNANPFLSNVTLIGNGEDGKYGMKLREGTMGYISNFIVSNFAKRSINVEHMYTLNHLNSGDLYLNYGYINSNVSDSPVKYSQSDVDSTSDDYKEGDQVVVIEEDKKIENQSNITIEDLLASATISTIYAGEGIDNSTADLDGRESFFSSTTYIGAGSDWLAGWANSAE